MTPLPALTSFQTSFDGTTQAANNPLGPAVFLDGSALMDMAPYGLAVTEATYVRIRACDPSLWLFPRGEEPLGLRHLAPPHAPIFPEEFKRAFRERFSLKESREFYSVWECQVR